MRMGGGRGRIFNKKKNPPFPNEKKVIFRQRGEIKNSSIRREKYRSLGKQNRNALHISSTLPGGRKVSREREIK